MIDVIASQTVTVRFSVPDGTRPEIDKAIADRLRSDEALIWEDGPKGARAALCIGE
jgi:hypothetical protein